MRRYRIRINDVDVNEMLANDISAAITWAEMNSAPGDKLCVILNHCWTSPEDADIFPLAAQEAAR